VSEQAAKLRRGIILKTRVTKLNNKDNLFDAAASELHKIALLGRSFILDELNLVLEVYEGILADFTEIAFGCNIKRLILAVEEGTATLDDVEKMGVKFRKRLNKKNRLKAKAINPTSQDLPDAVTTESANRNANAIGAGVARTLARRIRDTAVRIKPFGNASKRGSTQQT